MSVSAQDKVVADFEKKLVDAALGTDHAYRKLNRLINFDTIATSLEKTYSHLGQPGIPAVRGLKAMLRLRPDDHRDSQLVNVQKIQTKHKKACIRQLAEPLIILFVSGIVTKWGRKRNYRVNYFIRGSPCKINYL